MPCAFGALALTGTWLVWPSPRVPTHEVRLLRVGQGMALLLRSPGAAILFDAGRSPGEAARDLARLRVRRLDALLLTHLDEDHTGGVATILERVRVDELVFPAAMSGRPEAIVLRRLAARGGVHGPPGRTR